MAIVNECKAKDPNNCRYHRPNADQEAFSAWKQAETRLEDLQARLDDDKTGEIYSAYLGAKYEVDEAEAEYNATSSGLVNLLLQQEAAGKAGETEKAEELAYKYRVAVHTLAQGEKINQIDNEAGGSLSLPPEKDTYKTATFTKGGNELWPETTGSNYDSSLVGVKLKSAINQELKKAIKQGHLPPHLTYDVRTRGNSVYCEIRGVTPEQLYEDAEAQNRWNMRKDAREVYDRVDSIVSSFNHYQYDEVEGRRNISHFWDSVNFESDWGRERRIAREAEKAARKQSGK